MKPLHTDDIVAGDGQIMRQQMIDNFKAIENNFEQIEFTLSLVESKTEKLQKALGLTDDDLKNL